MNRNLGFRAESRSMGSGQKCGKCPLCLQIYQDDRQGARRMERHSGGVRNRDAALRSNDAIGMHAPKLGRSELPLPR